MVESAGKPFVVIGKKINHFECLGTIKQIDNLLKAFLMASFVRLKRHHFSLKTASLLFSRSGLTRILT